jgi:3-oxoacyl-[acyl-carrier-protein] synthase-3
MKETGFEVPYDKWFTNLPYTGNVGSASIYIIMEELFKSGKLKKGEKLLCFIPESGRFSHCFMLLTVV